MPDPVPESLPRYRIDRSYRWNRDHAPDPVEMDEPRPAGSFTFAGLSTAGPLGVAAGPLLNGRWILYYASLGFDVLTYKTVRSVARECYDLPNLVHVPDGDHGDAGADVTAGDQPTSSWAVSFGMPSMEPDLWRRDIETTRRELADEKRLNVSVVGSVQPGWSLDELAEDYARCARWAVESGADTIEANLSCPNVSTCDGQLYQRPGDAALVAGAIRTAIGPTPLILKVGHVVDESQASELLNAVAGNATALAMTNSVPARIRSRDQTFLFGGERRGICGRATLQASCRQVAMFAELSRKLACPVKIIGVGGVSTVEHVQQYLAAGAECVQMATAAMLNPSVALEIKRSWPR